jgi:hypothetical protein
VLALHSQSVVSLKLFFVPAPILLAKIIRRAGTSRGPDMSTRFRSGDCVVYRKQKYSLRPSPHARGINPAPNGDYYSYEIDKFWTVIAVQPDHQVIVRTRRGKQLTLNADDPALRRAHWWERLLFRKRFPALRAAD